MTNNCEVNSLPHHDDTHALISGSSIVLQTIWLEDSIRFSLYATKHKVGLRGSLSKSAMLTTANGLELDIDEFMAESKSALCSQNGLPNFTYILDSNSFKFCKATEAFRAKYGEVWLEERDDVIDEIIRNSIQSIQSKFNQIESYRIDIERIEERFDEMKCALEKCTAEKWELETDLLTKFAALLNEKKKRIRELEGALKNRSAFDDYESDGSIDSDTDYSSQTYARQREPTPPPSTSNQSVIVDDAITVVPKRKNPSRIVRPDKEETEAKPSNSAESIDIYERETEMILDDM